MNTPEQAAPLVVLKGLVERVTYHNPENGYSVIKVNAPSERDLVTVVGHFSAVTAGESLRLIGTWANHPKHGPQFKVVKYELEKPATLTGVEKYLGSGLIKGVGPVTAKRMVAHFGMAIMEIIEQYPERLTEVPGVGKKRIGMIAKAWQEQKSIQEVMVFLQTHGVSTTFAVKIFKTYGDQAIEVVSHNPYRLAEDIWGIGFKTADQIAQALGMAPDAPGRLRAGLVHVLSEAADQGHMLLPRAQLLQTGTEILGVEPALLPSALDDLIETQGVVQEPVPGGEPACYLPALAAAERGAAQRLAHMLRREAEVPDDLAETLKRLEADEGLTLSDEQREAVLQALSSRVFVLTGGPGTGKTTTVKTIVRLLKAYEQQVLLGSPTGRAAKRLSEVTGEEARTLHRLLEFTPANMAFTRDADRPLEADVVLVDEASMLDTMLFNSLLKAVPPLGHLILVGDVNQLPSVGPGNVLKDVLASGKVPSKRLTQVFRQAQESLIITNAHRIHHGQSPTLIVPDGTQRSDCYFVEVEDPEEAAVKIANVVGKSLPKRFGLHPIGDIQVLCPMNRGSIGANNLNTILQASLNPSGPGKDGVQVGSRVFRLGDKVIQLRNNYDKQVFNGDMGVIQAIDPEEQVVTVQTLEAEIEYDYSDLNELALAYAISVHKSQGSEFPAVVMPMLTQHYPMLQRNLLYTGLTRAKRVVVLVGTRKAIGIAVRNAEVGKRFTRLCDRLISD
jgi:exodeoxyribonuclease V alpha subunit